MMSRTAAKWTISLLIPLLACQPREQPGDGSEEGQRESAQAEGAWKTLFDGETFDGWQGLGRDSVPGGHWIIEDGSIRKVASGAVPTAPDGQPLEGGDLMTVETYRDFELVFEWKVSPGANSGIKYNVSEAMSTVAPPVYAALGFEYQVLDDDLHPDAQNGPNRTAGGLYDLVPPGPNKELRPVGSFNQAFDSVFALSKYLPIEGFADQRAGHIVLQDHGDDVWFRNIKIREFAP